MLSGIIPALIIIWLVMMILLIAYTPIGKWTHIMIPGTVVLVLMMLGVAWLQWPSQ